MSKTMHAKIHTFPTPLGWMALVGEERTLNRSVFGYTTPDAAVHAAMRWDRHWSSVVLDTTCAIAAAMEQAKWSPFFYELAERLTRFAAGEVQSFSDIRLDVNALTPFSQRVLAACRTIPWGQTSTYGELARRCGSPGAARAVGNILARNRFPIIVPCHRILPANGQFGGFSAPQGTAMKKRLLAMEHA
ncbi:MAG: MGMT family protein [Pirellulales bacterium]|nr:MGMT family protein [Pirellulales bacterium]